jgi:hypothetical protein
MSTFSAIATGSIKVSAKRSYKFNSGENPKLDDAVIAILRDRCADFDVGTESVYLYVDTTRSFEDLVVTQDRKVCLLGLVNEATKELEDWLDSIEQELDRCAELYEEKAKAVAEASTDALLAELASRGVVDLASGLLKEA